MRWPQKLARYVRHPLCPFSRRAAPGPTRTWYAAAPASTMGCVAATRDGSSCTWRSALRRCWSTARCYLPPSTRFESNLDRGLDEQAVLAVTQWRFEPGQRAGAPVDVFVTIMLDFSIR